MPSRDPRSQLGVTPHRTRWHRASTWQGTQPARQQSVAPSLYLPTRPGDDGAVQVKAIGAALVGCITFGDHGSVG